MANTITTSSLDFTNAEFMINNLMQRLLDMQDNDLAYELLNDLFSPIQFIADVGSVQITMQFAQLGKLSAGQAVAVYNALLLKHKANVETTLSWELNDV